MRKYDLKISASDMFRVKGMLYTIQVNFNLHVVRQSGNRQKNTKGEREKAEEKVQ